MNKPIALKGWNNWQALLTASFFPFLVAFVWLTAFFLSSDETPHPGELIAGFVSLFVGAILVFLAFKWGRVRIAFDDIELKISSKGKLTSVAWKDITSINFVVTRGKMGLSSSKPGLKLQIATDTSSFKFATAADHLMDTINCNLLKKDECQKLADFVVSRTAPTILRKAVAAFNSEGEVGFGPLRVAAGGIEFDGYLLKWESQPRFTTEPGYINIYSASSKQPWRKLPSSKIWNLNILAQFLDEIGKLPAKKEKPSASK